MRSVRSVLLLALGVAVALVLPAAPAAAGGSWFEPAQDRYAAGEEATLVGYTGGGQLGWVEDGPFYGYLRAGPDRTVEVGGTPLPSDRPLGPLTLQQTGRGGYLGLRAAITFTLPADLPAGTYEFVYCNDPCTTGLGDLIAGTVWVDVDPPDPITREWPADDPALRGEPASVPLPPPPPTTAPPPTTEPPSTTTSPSTSSLPPAPPPDSPEPGAGASGTDASGGSDWSGPGRGVGVGLAVGIGVLALVGTAFLRGRRRHPAPATG